MDFVRENRKTIGYVADEDSEAKKAKDAADHNDGGAAEAEDNKTRT
jgi:hypothetical protein